MASRVPDDFQFAVKAWQALTHTNASPTWNNHRDDIPDERIQQFGSLRPNEAVFDAWADVRARIAALEAPVCLIQTPPSFGPSDEHVANLRAFVDGIDRSGIDLAWEPRGDWFDAPDLVAELCTDLDLVQVVDPFRDEPLDDHAVAYCRLHGRNDDRFDYDYSRAELDDLAGRFRSIGADRETVYCYFNNYEMDDNARTFKAILAE